MNSLTSYKARKFQGLSRTGLIITLVCADDGLQLACGGGLSVSAIFCLKFQRTSSSLTIPTVLTKRSAFKAKCSLGDEHCFVKGITLS